METVPVIDVSSLNSSKLSDRTAVAAELGRACRGIGFFFAANHGIPDSLREDLFSASRTFFALPLEKKNELSILRSPHDRGYVALKGERLDQTAAVADHKEAFNVGLELAPDDPEVLAGKPFRGVNFWPTIPGWRKIVLQYFDACWALGRQIHRGALCND